jgi:hypothetical protein
MVCLRLLWRRTCFTAFFSMKQSCNSITVSMQQQSEPLSIRLGTGNTIRMPERVSLYDNAGRLHYPQQLHVPPQPRTHASSHSPQMCTMHPLPAGQQRGMPGQPCTTGASSCLTSAHPACDYAHMHAFDPTLQELTSSDQQKLLADSTCSVHQQVACNVLSMSVARTWVAGSVLQMRDMGSLLPLAMLQNPSLILVSTCACTHKNILSPLNNQHGTCYSCACATGPP